VNWLFAAAFLVTPMFSSRTLIARMIGHAVTLPNDAWQRLNLAWILFFIAVGALNLFVAYTFEEATWVNFKLFGLMGLTLVFALAQGFYLARHMPDTKTAGDTVVAED
jgi:intracellular septation protein